MWIILQWNKDIIKGNLADLVALTLVHQNNKTNFLLNIQSKNHDFFEHWIVLLEKIAEENQ